MKSKTIRTLSNKIYSRFPEMKGSKPKVQMQKSFNKRKLSGQSNYLLTFRKSVSGPGGKSIPRSVRVVADAEGKILKVTTSR